MSGFLFSRCNLPGDTAACVADRISFRQTLTCFSGLMYTISHEFKFNKELQMRLRKEIDEMQEKDILLIARISDALAHPARIKIFRYIMEQNKKREKVCNKDLVGHFDYSQATISQHVKKLSDAGLVQVQRADRFSYYYVHLGVLNDYLVATKKFENMGS